MITFNLQPTDLSEMRFAYRPLIELSLSYRVWRDIAGCRLWNGNTYDTWQAEVDHKLEGIQFPHMDAVMLNRGRIADFVTPSPTRRVFEIEDDLEALRQTPAEVIRDDVHLLLKDEGQHASILDHYIENPKDALECLTMEMAFYWEQALAPHWTRMQSILEADVIYHARRMATDGMDTLLSSLHQVLSYSADKLIITYESLHRGSNNREYKLHGQGLQLVPAIFSPSVWWQFNEVDQPMIIYGARGAGLWQQEPLAEVNPALGLMMGEGRARVFSALSAPVNTSEIAHSLHLTPGAVSQHLSRLQDAGLVESQRSGNRVYYHLSYRGEQLIEIFGV